MVNNAILATVIVKISFIAGALYCFTYDWNTAGGWMVFGAICVGYSVSIKED